MRLLQAGRAAEAETVYWADFARNHENRWALFGLMQSLKAQEKTSDAQQVEKRFRAASVRALSGRWTEERHHVRATTSMAERAQPMEVRCWCGGAGVDHAGVR
jgi:hypothetical protein